MSALIGFPSLMSDVSLSEGWIGVFSASNILALPLARPARNTGTGRGLDFEGTNGIPSNWGQTTTMITNKTSIQSSDLGWLFGSHQKRYVTFSADAYSANLRVGLTKNGATFYNHALGDSADHVGLANDGNIWFNGSSTSTSAAFNDGDFITMKVDFEDKLLYFKVNSGDWVPTGGFDVSSMSGAGSPAISGISLSPGNAVQSTIYPGRIDDDTALSGYSLWLNGTGIFTIKAIISNPTATDLLVGLVRHNFSLDATVRMQGFSDSAMTDSIFDSTFDVWPSGGDYDQNSISAGNWSWIGRLIADTAVAAVQLDVTDSTNDAGFLQVGLLEIARTVSLPVALSPGSQYGFRFRTQTAEAPGGARYFDRRLPARQFSGVIAEQPHDTALSGFLSRLRQQDLDTPFLWVPDESDAQNMPRTAYLARQLDPGLYARIAAGVDKVPFKFEEVIG